MITKPSANTATSPRSNPILNAKTKTSVTEQKAQKQSILDSWHNALSIRQEEIGMNKELIKPGLRKPQIKAIYELLGHWISSREAGTVVMPTGTGKTEVMLALMIQRQISRLLIVVPSDSLRRQIAGRFQKLGVLPTCEILALGTLPPIVCRLEHGIKYQTEVDALWGQCHVVVATMNALNACPETIRHYLAETSEYVFIDEAHHCPANTWQYFHNRCRHSFLLQFTATPFREDGKRLEGKFLSVYPMKEAQREGYFKPIDVYGIYEYEHSAIDQAIADQAVAKLKQDLDQQLDHIIMARVETID